MRRTLLVLSSLLALLLLAGCASVDIGGTGFMQHLGMATTTAQSVHKASREITEDEEYYVGRAVAARVLATYPLLENKALTEYVNSIGMALSLQSEKPYTYGGYHFAVLDTKEVNAFACPGGIIFITRGMLQTVENEEQLAAVLAHEIGHVIHRDGIASIKQARWTEALTVIGTRAASTYGPAEVAQLVNIFEGSIDDIFKTLVVNGYSKSQERDADQSAMPLLAKTGYSAQALKDLLDRFAAQAKDSDGGILKTHPPTSDRIENISGSAPQEKPDPALVKKRSDRFASLVTR